MAPCAGRGPSMHAFLLSKLAGEGTASGEGRVLRAADSGAVRIAARLPTS